MVEPSRRVTTDVGEVHGEEGTKKTRHVWIDDFRRIGFEVIDRRNLHSKLR